jgi:predicted phosphodiesterase
MTTKSRSRSLSSPPSIRFLFRFRDLIANTIVEHDGVIGRRGTCWWGWWRRPREDQHAEIWQELQEQLQERRRVVIGFFDSGSDKVYAADAIEVIGPQPGDPPGYVPVPSDEKELIPEYYRDSPYSRAWIKLERIYPSPIDFFGSYSYLNSPRLSSYSPDLLKKLKDKVIASPAELRSMDTTIWEVRERRAGDPRGEILLTDRSASDSVSREPIALQSNAILHLTDLHFGVGKSRKQHIWRLEGEPGRERPSLADALDKVLGERSIGAVVVSGDFTFTGSDGEFREAEVFLERLLVRCNLDTDRLVVIPGNHDIKWSKKTVYDSNAPVDVAPAAAKKNYIDFYRRMFGHEPRATLAMGRRFVLPSGITLDVCALNSSSLASGANFLAGMGRIQENAFSEVAGELQWPNGYSMGLRMLVVHHHLTLTEDLEHADGYARGFGIAVDAARIQRLAAEHGVQLALHGHKHRAFIWRSSVYALPEHAHKNRRLGGLSIVGGGSVGSVDTESRRNYFNILEVVGGGMKLDIYRAAAGGAFSSMQTWLAQLEISPTRHQLVLGDWEELGG